MALCSLRAFPSCRASGAILAMVPVSAQEEDVWCLSRSDEPTRDVSGEEQAVDLPLLRLFSQIANSFEASYTDDQALHGLMRTSWRRLRSVA